MRQDLPKSSARRQDAALALRLADEEMRVIEAAAGQCGVDTRGSWENPML